MRLVKKASQRRLASHTHKHDPDIHGDQPRDLIFQPELTSKPYQARLKTMAVKELCTSTGTAIQKILQINQQLKQEFGRNQNVIQDHNLKHFFFAFLHYWGMKIHDNQCRDTGMTVIQPCLTYICTSAAAVQRLAAAIAKQLDEIFTIARWICALLRSRK